LTTTFAITYDYLCPFARNANEAVVEALKAGDDWDVTFRPFSLQQNHSDSQDLPVWDRSIDDDPGSGVRALLWSLAIRDRFADRFMDFHVALFAARHDRGLLLGDEDVIRSVATSVGLDANAVADVVASSEPRETLRSEHTSLVEDHAVFGVPTFIANGQAVFVRVMDRHNVGDIRRIVDMTGWVNLNEFKRTQVPK